MEVIKTHIVIPFGSCFAKVYQTIDDKYFMEIESSLTKIKYFEFQKYQQEYINRISNL